VGLEVHDSERYQDCWYRYGEIEGESSGFSGLHDAEAASAKSCADKRSRGEISVGVSEGTSGVTGMQG